MTSWDVLKYLYFGSCIAMALYIISKSDQFLISYGMNELESEREGKEKGLSFTATMILYVVISPVLWMVILSQNNRKK